MFGYAFLATMGLLASANAHLFIKSPTPISGNAQKPPLLADGSNFPCQGANIPTSGGQSMAAGSSQLLQFDEGTHVSSSSSASPYVGGPNTAVHGGGSCQMSITYETDPAKLKDPKNWFVIYSMEGGCPSNTAGNLDGQYTGPMGAYSGAIQCSDPHANGVDCINEFNYTIPQGVKSGNAVLAWSWMNAIGNREFYMDCSSVSITGGDGSAMSNLPTMYVANLGTVSDNCATDYGSQVQFPFPGDAVTTKLAKQSPSNTMPLKLATESACASMGKGGSSNAASGGSSSGGSSAGASASAAPSSSATPSGSASASGAAVISSSYVAPSASASESAPASAAAGSGAPITITTLATVTGTGVMPGPTEQSSAAGGSGSSPALSSSASAAAPSAPAATSGSSSSSGSCGNGAVSCSNEGAMVCLSSGQFGICDHGCAVPQPLAAGTTCTNGKIAALSGRDLSRYMRRRGLRST